MSDDLARLAAPFPRDLEQNLRKGGTNLTYLPISAVIARTNEVLGMDWSYTVVSTEVVGDWVIAHVRVRVERYLPAASDAELQVGHWESTERDGFGGQEIKHRRDGQILDMGHDFKGAVSDALKKALQAFGVGLYLATHDESLRSTFDDGKAAGAGAVRPRPDDLPGGDTAPAAGTPDVRDALLELAERSKSLGFTPAELRKVASKALGRTIKKASDIATHDDVEKVNQHLDLVEEAKKEQEADDKEEAA